MLEFVVCLFLKAKLLWQENMTPKNQPLQIPWPVTHDKTLLRLLHNFVESIYKTQHR